MVLRGQHDVFGACFLEYLRPVTRVEQLGGEFGCKFRVGLVVAIDSLMERDGGVMARLFLA
jgi:hypothetical protein